MPEHVIIENNTQLKWKIYVNAPGMKNVDVSYSNQNKNTNSNLNIIVNGTQLSHTIQPTGKTVGEPNSDWVIDNYRSHRLGQMYFPEKGYYEIELQVSPAQKEEVRFQWIWIK